MSRTALWVALLLLALSTTTFAQGKNKDKAKTGGNPEEAIMNLEDQMKDAVIKGDAAGVEKHLANNYVRVYPDGTLGDRQQSINDLKESKYTSIDTSEKKVFVSGNTAVSVFKASVKGSRKGQSIDGDYRGVRTWIKEGGEWKAVAFSTTKIGGM
jgi:ketosteroid isomerase-like protein